MNARDRRALDGGATAWDLGICLVLLASVIVLYSKVLTLWWTYDDAFHLHRCSTSTVAAILFSRSFWHSLPNGVFTPLLFLSIKADWFAFGANARAFYVHHLVSFAIVVFLIYAVARLWLSEFRAFIVAAIALSGPPMCETVEQLYHRHYIEGLACSLLAVLLFVRNLRRDRPSVGSAVAYLAAMAAKEVYVPLLAVLLAIPEKGAGRRARNAIPHFVSVAIYAVWRIVLLGPAASAYGLTPGQSKWGITLATLPARAVLRLGGRGDVQSVAFLAILGATILFTLVLAPRMRLVVTVIVLSALLPVIPVAAQIETRFVITLWIGAVAAAAGAPRALLPFLLVATVAANRAEWNHTFEQTARMADEARFFGAMKQRDILLDPRIPPGAMRELSWLTKSRGSFLYDELPVCTGAESGRLFRWSEPIRDVQEVTEAFVRRTTCHNVISMPLSAAFVATNGVLFWRFGPYDTGVYAVVLGNGTQAFDVPRDAGFRVGAARSVELRVRYTSPAGWLTYSPNIALDLRRQPNVTWRR